MEIETFLIIFALFKIKVFLLSLLYQVIKEVLPPRWSLQKYNKNGNKYALITGATDGIGLGFAEVLAEKGWNICLIARNEEKMKMRIKEIRERVKQKQEKQKSSNEKVKEIEIKYIIRDFANCGQPQFTEDLVSEIKGLGIEIGILVNNVGTSEIAPLEKLTPTQITNIITINCISMSTLTCSLLPMLDKENSAIINLSSFLGEIPAPYSTVYCGTKAFNDFFSKGLSLEDHPQIDVLSVKPMFVESPLSKQKKGFAVPDRRQCAEACLKELCWGEYETNGYFLHRVLAIVALAVPKFIARFVAKKVSFIMMKNYYGENYAKKE